MRFTLLRIMIAASVFFPTTIHGQPAGTSGMQRTVQITERKLHVNGTVVDAEGKGVADAKIQLFNHHVSRNQRTGMRPQSTVHTDTNGAFSMITSDNYGQTLLVEAPGFIPSVEQVADTQMRHQLMASQQTSATVSPRIVLQKSASIRAQVADSNGVPLSGVTVTALPVTVARHSPFGNEPLARGQSDGDGQVKLTDVPDSDLMLMFSAPGYATAWTTGRAGEEVVVNLGHGATVVGKAVFEETGEPAKGVELVLAKSHNPPEQEASQVPAQQQWSSTAVVGESGTFSIRNVPPGSFQLLVPTRENEQKHAVWDPEGSLKARVTVSEADSKVGVDISIFSGHTLTGTVVESGTSTTVAGAKVWMVNDHPHRFAVTDQTGVYTFDKIFPNSSRATLQLTAEHPDFAMPMTDHGSMSTRTLECKLSSASPATQFNIPMTRQRKIGGIVIDDNTSAPVAGARIQLVMGRHHNPQQEDKNAVTSEADGTFTFSILPTVEGRLRVEAPGYSLHVSDVIRAELSDGITVRLARGAKISGVVVNDRGTSEAGSNVSAKFSIQGTANTIGESTSYHEDLKLTVTSDEDGRFTMDRVPVNGDVILHASKQGFAPARPATYALEPAEEQSSVVLQLRAAKHLSGRVLDSSGSPLAGVHLNANSVNDYGGDHARTGPDGTYRLDDLPDAPVDVSLMIMNQGMEWFYDVEVGRDGVDFQVGKGDKTQMGRYMRDLQRSRGKDGVTLKGKVVDYRSGQAVTGFKVAAPQGMKVTLDDDVPGGFTVTGLYRNSPFQNIRISAPGYALYNSGNIFVEEGLNEVSRTFKLGPGGSIKGRAIDNQSKAAVAGVVIELDDTQMHPYQSAGEEFEKVKPAVSDAEGNFVLTGIGHGLKRIKYTPPPSLGCIEMSQEVDVVYNEVSDVGDVKFGAGGIIKGSLVRTPGDVPIPNAAIQMRGGKATTTAADGSFEFTELKNGIYMVEAPEYGSNSWIGIEQLETKELKLEVGTGKLLGTVTRGGQPVASSVFAQKVGYGQSVSRSTRADASGKFTVDNLPPGRWRVSVSATVGGNQVSATEFVVMPTSGESIEQAFVLPSGGIQVTVVDAGGKPVEGATVIARRQNGPDAVLQADNSSAVTGATGNATFDGLEPGSYSITATMAEDLRGDATGITLANDQVIPVTIKLESDLGGTLVSTALNMQTGRPVPTAWCYLFDDKGAMFEHGGQRDEMGILRIEQIPAGTYRVQVSAFGFSANEQRVTISAGQEFAIHDVLYPAGALRWALRDATGAAVVNAPCTLTPTEAESIESVRTGVSNQDGTFVVRGLMPGAYTARVSPPGRKSTTALVMIHAGNATDHVTLVE